MIGAAIRDSYHTKTPRRPRPAPRNTSAAIPVRSLMMPKTTPARPIGPRAGPVPAEWPWGWITAWALFAAALLFALAAWQRNSRERRRAQALLRVGQVARLNTLGELAGGIAHELNQPLTAVLASAQAARRLLDDD